MERAKDFIADEQWVARDRRAPGGRRRSRRNRTATRRCSGWRTASIETGDHGGRDPDDRAARARSSPRAAGCVPARSLRVEIAQRLNRDDVLWTVAAPPPPPAPQRRPQPPRRAADAARPRRPAPRAAGDAHGPRPSPRPRRRPDAGAARAAPPHSRTRADAAAACAVRRPRLDAGGRMVSIRPPIPDAGRIRPTPTCGSRRSGGLLDRITASG